MTTRPAPVPVEVDRDARRAMALLVRRLISRRIDNFEFDDGAGALLDSRDPALHGAYLWCWGLYDDFKRHRIERLPPELRREAARIVVFLRTDLAYCWVEKRARRMGTAWWAFVADGLAWLLVGLKLPVVGILAAAVRLVGFYTPDLVAPRTGVEEDRDEAWPFADRAELTAAIAAPTYLAG